MGSVHSNHIIFNKKESIHRVYTKQLYTRFNNNTTISNNKNNTNITEICHSTEDISYNSNHTDADELSNQLGVKLKQYEQLEILIRQKETYDAMNVRSKLSTLHVTTREINAAIDQLFISIESNTVSTTEYLLLSYPEMKPHLNNARTCSIANRNLSVTPLMLASVCGNNIIISLLLQIPNVDINAVEDETRLSALMFAVMYGQTSSVETLVQYDSLAINYTDTNNYTALQLATKLDEIQIVNLLCKRKDINLMNQTNNGDTVLHIAARNENEEIIETLMSTSSKLAIQKSSIYNGNHLWKLASPTVTNEAKFSDSDSDRSDLSSPKSYDADCCLSPRASVIKFQNLQSLTRIINKNHETAYSIIEEIYRNACTSPSKTREFRKINVLKERLRKLM